ncbi:MAG: hypothetical protein HYU69_12880 [Bacteroidetes bacterium]|nr:hypothetical protein [Bacteroidota bacterium]
MEASDKATAHISNYWSKSSCCFLTDVVLFNGYTLVHHNVELGNFQAGNLKPEISNSIHSND